MSLGISEPYFRLPTVGEVGNVGLHRGDAELGIVSAQWPEQSLGLHVGTQPRGQLLVYVDDVDRVGDTLRTEAVPILKEPQAMPSGEGWRTSLTRTRTGWR